MNLSSENPASSSVLAQLRAATGEQHAALDRSLVSEGESLTRENYEALLVGSLAVLEVLEGYLTRSFPMFGEPSRVACLKQDLAELAVHVRVPVPDVPRPSCLAEAFGCAYVVEGSALGGLVLARSVRHLFAPEAHAPRYLTLRSDQTGPHFRSFCRELEAWGAGATDSQRALACGGANATFAAYAFSIGAARRTLAR